ncbi:MAG: hypothetical protein ABMA26_13275 [Limisphaerales bacterium]
MKLNDPPDPLIEQALDKFAAEQGLTRRPLGGALTPAHQRAFDLILTVCELGCTPPERYRVNHHCSPNIVSELEHGGADILGLYDRESGGVTLCVQKCRQVAEELGCLPSEVETVVLIHEWSHLVHHRGTLASSRNHWCDFPRMWQFADTDVEDLAEKTAFLVLHGIVNGEQLRAVQIRLAKMSPPSYRKWLTDFGAWLNSGVVPENSIEDLRRKLRMTRDTTKRDVLKEGAVDS